MSEQPRDRIRQWLREHDTGEGQAARADLVAACFSELSSDTQFVTEFTRWYLPVVIEKIATGMIRAIKPPQYQHRVADRLMTVAQLRDEMDREETPWSRWMHQEANVKVTPLLEMTKPDLIRAVETKKRQGDVAYKDAAFFKAIADTLDGNQAVGDVWKANDLTELYDRISLRIKADVVLSPMLSQGAAD